MKKAQIARGNLGGGVGIGEEAGDDIGEGIGEGGEEGEEEGIIDIKVILKRNQKILFCPKEIA